MSEFKFNTKVKINTQILYSPDLFVFESTKIFYLKIKNYTPFFISKKIYLFKERKKYWIII